MNVNTNTRIIRRNATLGKIFGFTGFGGLILALLFSFSRPDIATPLLVLALISSLISQVGIGLYSQWGRRPRLDEILNDALKGLDDSYTLFHYCLGPAHALITPEGAFAILPKAEAGKITFEDDRFWAHTERSGLLRRPRRRSIKRALSEAQDDVEALERALARALGIEAARLDVHTGVILLFINADAEIEIEASPIPTVHIKKLKDFIRKLPKGKSLSRAELDTILETLG